MARSRKPAAKAQPLRIQPAPRDPMPLPEWWAPPVANSARTRNSDPHYSSGSASAVLTDMAAGHLAIPPWQRDNVWSAEQRYAMIDSMARGLPLGPIIVWRPMFNRIDLTGARSLPGCPIADTAGLVIDGQQRLTTLAMAAAGDLDLRWTGERFHTGKGVVDLRRCLVDGSRDDLFDLVDAVRDANHDTDASREIYRIHTRMTSYLFSFLVLQTNDLGEVVETYRRLATCGSPHSIDDLSVMERWLEAQGQFEV
jgi:hypothetical protein